MQDPLTNPAAKPTQSGPTAGDSMDVHYAVLKAENAKLREQIHDLCHDKHVTGPVTPDEFCNGCEQFQKKLFGHSPIEKLRAALTAAETKAGAMEEAFQNIVDWCDSAVTDPAVTPRVQEGFDQIRNRANEMLHPLPPAPSVAPSGKMSVWLCFRKYDGFWDNEVHSYPVSVNQQWQCKEYPVLGPTPKPTP